MDEFENDSVNYCDVTYSVEFDQSLTWMSALSSGRGVQYFTDENDRVGTYEITVTATGSEGATSTATFTLEVTVDCSS